MKKFIIKLPNEIICKSLQEDNSERHLSSNFSIEKPVVFFFINVLIDK